MRRSILVLLSGVAALVAGLGPATATPAPLTWSQPTTLVSDVGVPRGISCPLTTFCMVVDQSGQAVPIDHGVRGAPMQVGAVLQSVSCMGPAFCLAGDRSGHVFVMRGSAWTHSLTLSGQDTYVTCVSKSFCFAAAGYRTARFNGHSWTVALTSRSGAVFDGISCGATTVCAATGYHWTDGGPNNRVYRWNGAHWSSAVALPDNGNHVVVSPTCAGSYCAGLVGHAVFEWTSRGWRFDSQTPLAGDVDRMSCTSATFCLAVSMDGSPGISASHFDGTRWSNAEAILNTGNVGGVWVSCRTAHACTVVDRYGDGRSWTGSWGAAAVLDLSQGTDESGGLRVSCGAPTLCLAMDLFGNYMVYRGSSWSAPHRIAPTAQGLSEISCYGAEFCLTMDSQARAWIYNGSSWRLGPTAGLSPRYGGPDFSCGSSRFCVAISGDNTGKLATVYDGARWSAPHRYDTLGRALTSISCTASRYCGVTESGSTPQLFTFDGTRWTHVGSIPVGDGEDARASCSGVGSCLFVSSGPAAAVYRDGAFHQLTADADAAGVSCASDSFCVLDQIRQYQVWDGTALSDPLPLTGDWAASNSSISCVRTAFCAAVGTSEAVVGQ